MEGKTERQKTESELKQEESDAALARQLQEELDADSGTPQPPVSAAAVAVNDAQQATESDVIDIPCPVCTFINSVRPSPSKTNWSCSQCGQSLNDSPAPPMNSEREARRGNRNEDLVECQICHCLNRMPTRKSDAVLCGGCYQALGSSLNSPSTGGGAATAASASKKERVVQVRCGQCNAVNALNVASDLKEIQFECGGCSTVNTVSLE